MYYTLTENSKKILLNLGETGMGYQHILVDGKSYLILNNEYAVEWNDYFEKNRFFDLDFKQRLTVPDGARKELNLNGIVTLIPNPLSKPVVPPGIFAPPPFIYKTLPGDIFYRLSAFALDHCILSPTELRCKCYTITENDIKEVPSGLAAVARYALPSRLPNIYVWKIIPPINTSINVGTVIPNFGMSGGGVEAYFPSGFIGGVITQLPDIPVM